MGAVAPRPCRRVNEIDVAFVEPLYDQNVGFIARAMKNFCLGRLVLVNPRCPLGVEAIKYSMHGVDKLKNAVFMKSVENLVSSYDYVLCSTGKIGSSIIRRSMTPEEAAKRIVSFTGRRVVVIGREDRGLSNEELKLCDAIVTIPANPEYPILNASHAATILFYIIYRTAHENVKVIERPSREELEHFIEYLTLLAKELGMREEKIDGLKTAARRLLAETTAPAQDLSLLFGVIRKSYEKIRALTDLERGAKPE